MKRSWSAEDHTPTSQQGTGHGDIPGGGRSEIDLAVDDNHSLVVEITRYGQVAIDQQDPIAGVAVAVDGEGLVGINGLDGPGVSP